MPESRRSDDFIYLGTAVWTINPKIGKMKAGKPSYLWSNA